MPKATPISIAEAFTKLRFLPDRTPETTDEERKGAFARLADFRDGGIFTGHYAGNSEWERHPKGDELVMVVEGRTTLYLLTADGEIGNPLGAGELLVVPENTWHRFETPEGVKVMAITPQPSDHQTERPSIG